MINTMPANTSRMRRDRTNRFMCLVLWSSVNPALHSAEQFLDLDPALQRIHHQVDRPLLVQRDRRALKPFVGLCLVAENLDRLDPGVVELLVRERHPSKIARRWPGDMGLTRRLIGVPDDPAAPV